MQATTTDFYCLEFKFYEQEYLRELFQDNPSLPYGFNKNSIQVNPDDYSSVIAYALCSNLYIEGLMKINYMDLNNRVSTYTISTNDDKITNMQDTDYVISKNEKLRLTEKNDVLNNTTSNHDIENELLNTENVKFSFSFLNYGPPKNITLKIYRSEYL